jgi:uncharacterized paraquat-inducible protein A
MTPVPPDGRTGHPSQLRCEDCGLVYSRAAIVREMTLAVGAACRRCGGTLEASHVQRVGRNRVVAVRSAVKGSTMATRAP